ncbi:MAG: LptF/LptG family permease, partial [Cyclobacteriaceae bacterium]|nr:LptF/LptG family permease [Cyclobacteriaceae bacterium HetDA_MAG_MS6]
RYERMDLVFNLSSFDLKRTKEELFQNNRQMKNISELSRDIDSLISETVIAKTNLITNAKSFLKYHAPSVLTVDNQKPNAKKVKFKKSKKGNDEEDDEDSKEVVKEQTASFFPFDWISQQRDTTHQLHIDKVQPDLLIKSEITKLQDSLTLGSDSTELLVNVNPLDTMTLDGLDANFNLTRKKVELISRASSQARNLKVSINSSNIRLKRLATERAKYIIEKYKKFSQAFACIVMFLIGAPLGAIIKKGGLGVPVIVSVFFFIVYYVLNITNEKWAKAGLMHGEVAVWVADLILLPVGLFFLRQARIDARLFENDFYLVWIDKIKQRLTDRKNRKVAQARLAG